MAPAGGDTIEPDRPREPHLAVATGILAPDRGADHARRHDTALRHRIPGHARLVGPAGAVGLGRTDPLQADLLAAAAMDRAIDIVQRDRVARERTPGGDKRQQCYNHQRSGTKLCERVPIKGIW